LLIPVFIGGGIQSVYGLMEIWSFENPLFLYEHFV
jgi:hypothetical protein